MSEKEGMDVSMGSNFQKRMVITTSFEILNGYLMRFLSAKSILLTQNVVFERSECLTLRQLKFAVDFATTVKLFLNS